ncbi:hypothetical protein K439DRAFT_1620056 [Ramaria rubella]|nr:hypothetical protein K439DRAFT_1620056 [Ramaria rubella]
MLPHLLHRRVTHCKLIPPFIIQLRLRHQPPHRTINVRLLDEIPGIGSTGSIQSVPPGRMRSVFYPQKKAAYLLKGLTSRLPHLKATRSGDPLPSREEDVDFEIIKSRLQALAPLMFYRPLLGSFGHSSTPTLAERQVINGCVTLHDIRQLLKETHNLPLVAPHVTLSFQDASLGEQIRLTGSFIILAHLRPGDTITFEVHVEPGADLSQKGSENALSA